MATDYSSLSDRELDEIIAGRVNAPPGEGLKASAQARKAVGEKESRINPQEDTSLGMSGLELFGAGAGYAANELVEGVKELPQVLFRPPGPPGEEQLSKINSARAARKEIGKKLLQNWEAQAGNLTAEAALSSLAPANIPAQVALQSGLSALRAPTKSSGALTELGGRALGGLESGILTAAVGIPMSHLGRVIGASAGKFTPSGKKALEVDSAFRRLGGNATLRDLDPSSELAGFEGSLISRAKVVEDQADKFRQAARSTVDVPSATGRSYETKVLEGEKVRQGIVQATDNLKARGSELWRELDAHIGKNQLEPVIPQLSFTQSESILQKYTPLNKKGHYVFEKNPIFQRVAYYDEDAATNLIHMSRAPSSAVKYGAPFSDLHQIQSAVGKALGRARKDAGAPGAGQEAREAATELSKLYATISQDVDNWMQKVATSGDTELTQKALMARDFWRDRVVPGTQGSLVQKARKGTWRQDPRGYAEPTQMYSDLSSAKTQVEELLPFMNPEQRDLVTSFGGMADLQKVLKSGEAHPPASGMGMLTNLGGMMIGSPLQLMKGAISHAPVLKGGLGHPAMKRLYFAEDAFQNSPAGRLAWMGAQYPLQSAEDWEKQLLSRE